MRYELHNKLWKNTLIQLKTHNTLCQLSGESPWLYFCYMHTGTTDKKRINNLLPIKVKESANTDFLRELQTRLKAKEQPRPIPVQAG
jgi:hypothetical protein